VEVETVSLANKVIHIASKYGNGLTVSWVNLGGDFVEFFYMNEAGQPTSRIETVTTQSSYIPDFGSTPLNYRTLYLSKGMIGDTLRAPLTDFTGAIRDLTLYIRSSPAENVIKAADFDIGGEGIGFHNSDVVGIYNILLTYRRDRGDTRSDVVLIENGTAIGRLRVDNWYKYTIDVLDAGNYALDVNVAVNGGSAKCRVEVDGEMSEDYSLINNGNNTAWRYYFDFYRIDPPTYYLSAGKHEIKFHIVGTGFNYNGLRLTYKP
jgi:hypothetical protein